MIVRVLVENEPVGTQNIWGWWVSKLDLYVYVAANYYANLHICCIKSTCRLCIHTWLKDVYRHERRAFGAIYMYLQWEEVKGEQHNGPERTVEQKMINSIWNIKREYTCMTLYIVQVVIFVVKLITYKWLFIQKLWENHCPMYSAYHRDSTRRLSLAGGMAGCLVHNAMIKHLHCTCTYHP